MAKATGMHHGKDRKTRGRSSITKMQQPNPTDPKVPEVLYTETNRGITANGNMNKHRGDRRDMSKTYSDTAKHSARGNTPRRDVKTRKR